MAALTSLMRTSIPAAYSGVSLASVPLAEPSYLDARVGRIFNRSEEVVIRRVKRHGESTIHNPAIDMDAKVNLHHIPLLNNNLLLARVGRIMSHAVVERQPRGKPHARPQAVSRLQAGVAQERAYAILDANGNVRERRLARLDRLLDPAADLAMHLGGFAVVAEERGVFEVLTSSGLELRCLGADRRRTVG